MKRKRLVWVGIASVLLAVAVVCFWPAPREPTYKGKPVSAWFKDYASSPGNLGLPSPKPTGAPRIIHIYQSNRIVLTITNRPAIPISTRASDKGRASLEAFQALGTNALPFLLAKVRIAKWEFTYERAFTNLPAVVKDRLPNPAQKWWHQQCALQLLEDVELSRAATPELVEMLDRLNPVGRARVLSGLRNMNQNIPANTQLLLRLGQRRDYTNVIAFASNTRWEGRPLAKLFGDILRSRHVSLHQDALKLLESTRSHGWIAKDALLEALRRPDREMRYLAARALEQIMAESPPKTQVEIVEALQKVVTDNDDMVRTVARRTLAKLGRPVSVE